MDELGKEEKEALVNKRMEEIRRKNEALERRHAEILADKKAAEKDGRMVNVKCTSNSPPLHRQELPVNRQTPPSDRPRQTPPSRGGRGRGRKIYTPQGPATPGQPQQEGGEDVGQEARVGMGRGKRLARMSAESRSTPPRSTANGSAPATPLQEMNYGPPPEPAYSFLQDRSREGPLPESRPQPQQQQQQQLQRNRHPRNYGGPDFNSVKMRVKNDRQQQEQKRYSAPVNSKWEMEMKMTGKERRDYAAWKKQREEIERDRITRHKTQSGEWKREWDVNKTDDYQDSPIQKEPIASHGTPKRPPSPPQSRRMEPARRPGGGSGRFLARDGGDAESERGPVTAASPGDSAPGPRSYDMGGLTVRVDTGAEDGNHRSVGMRGRGGGDYGGYRGGGGGNSRGARGGFVDRGRGRGDFNARGGGRGARGGYGEKPWNERPPQQFQNAQYPQYPGEDDSDRVPLRGKRPRGRKQHRPLSYTEGFTMVTITTGPGLNELEEKEGGDMEGEGRIQEMQEPAQQQQQQLERRNEQISKVDKGQATEEGEDEWEDAEEEVEEYFGDKSNEGAEEIEEEEEEEPKKRDHHNSSAESLERFIQEHTLDVDMETGTVIKKDKGKEKELSPLKTTISPESQHSQLLMSPEFMKTPEGHEKVLDWWTEVKLHGAVLTPEGVLLKPDFTKEEAQNLNMSVSSSEPVDSPVKDRIHNESPAKPDAPTTRSEDVQEDIRNDEAPEKGTGLSEAEKELEIIRARQEEVQNEIAMNERRLAEAEGKEAEEEEEKEAKVEEQSVEAGEAEAQAVESESKSESTDNTTEEKEEQEAQEQTSEAQEQHEPQESVEEEKVAEEENSPEAPQQDQEGTSDSPATAEVTSDKTEVTTDDTDKPEVTSDSLDKKEKSDSFDKPEVTSDSLATTEDKHDDTPQESNVKVDAKSDVTEETSASATESKDNTQEEEEEEEKKKEEKSNDHTSEAKEESGQE